MMKLHLSLLKRDFAHETGFVFIVTLIGFVFGYLYLVFMGRALGPEMFGIFGSLVGIFYIACLVGQALRVAIASNVAKIKASAGESAAINALLRLGIKFSFLYLLIPLFFITAAQPISSFFHLRTTGPILILGFALFTSLTLELVLGLLQGLQRFKHFALSGYLLSQGLKFFFGVTFIWLGWDLLGAIGALLASTIIAIAGGLVPIRKQLVKAVQTKGHDDSRLQTLLFPGLLLAVFISVPTSVDVMLVTHFFSAEQAGIYNATATLGKVVIFLPMAVSFVMLPKVAESYALGSDSKGILAQSLLYTALLSGTVALFYWILPDRIIRLFFGAPYIAAGSLVGWYGTAMVLFALNFLLTQYSLATQNRKQMFLASFITVGEVIAIVILHQLLHQVVLILLFGNLFLFLYSLFALVIPNRVQKL